MISAKELMPSWVKGRIDTTDSSPTPWWMKPEKDMPTPEMERLIEVQRSWHRAKQESVMRDNTREKRSMCNSPPPTEDQVQHPIHYTSHPSGVECIQITEHMGFNMGNALKYIWRADLKNDAIEDLQKAKWYIEREIALRSKNDA